MYYNPYYPAPMADNLAALRQAGMSQPTPIPAAPVQNSGGIVWVQGEEAAKAYLTAPGSSVLLMDSEGSRFYIKSTDQSGMPRPLRIFDFQERVNAPNPTAEPPKETNVEYVTRDEFERLAAVVGEIKGKGKKAVKEDTGNGE